VSLHDRQQFPDGGAHPVRFHQFGPGPFGLPGFHLPDIHLSGLFAAKPCGNGLCDICSADSCPGEDGRRTEKEPFLRIVGGRRLDGSLTVHGAKNSVLPILAACVLCKSPVLLSRVPRLSDTGVSLRILESLGCKTALSGSEAVIDPSGLSGSRIADRLVREMRSSVVFLGAVAARTGEAFLCLPGGCELGSRPIDLHLMGLRALGMTIEEKGEKLHAHHDGLRGAEITLPFPSVGATENILLAAVLADGRTTLRGAAREPEIVDLCRFLRRCGAAILGEGSSTLYIDGVRELHGCSFPVMADRIEAVTFLCCGGICGGDLTVTDFDPATVGSVLQVLREMGCDLTISWDRVRIRREGRLRAPGRIETAPFPGFPTDAQPMVMALGCLADGETTVREQIFESRFRHLPQFARMGADVAVSGQTAVIRGVQQLHGTTLHAHDLRSGAALITAALAAEGESRIMGLSHIDRGYEHPEEALASVGADIRRV
jgi:UDP-N-acetylglucosamine 1-carboxyvinyltransferase